VSGSVKPLLSVKKPSICPYCSCHVDATVRNSSRFDYVGGYLIATSLKCIQCEKTFFYGFTHGNDAFIDIAFIYPPSKAVVFNDNIIQTVSENFCKIYNQAMHAEHIGDFELAGVGIRVALENLVKDYAIEECGASYDDVANKTLAKCIEIYLCSDALFKTTDVVRILGNDYAHYVQKHPETDYSVLKEYMSIVISLIRTQLMIKHPPVERN